MSAKGHHFLPQFLLKGFASRNSRTECYCWYFRRGTKACEANIKGIGQQKHFHGNPRQTNLEVLIAERECVYAPLVQSLQKGEIEERDKPLIDEFVAHLVIRGRNLRQGFLKATDDLLTAMVKHFTDPKNHASRNDRLFEYVKKDPRFSTLLTSLPAEVREPFTRLFRKEIEELPIEDGMRQVMAVLQQSLPESASQAHIKTLSKDFAPQKQIEKMQHLSWKIWRVPSQTLIIGDVGVLFLEIETGQFKHPILVPQQPAQAFLPVSHEFMLVGTQVESLAIDTEQLNSAQAALSREFFVSSTRTEKELTYERLLGSRADLVSKAEISELLRSEF